MLGRNMSRKPKTSNSFDARCAHGSVYCAARNIHFLADTVLTVEDADRLLRAMSELHDLATLLRSPDADLDEIVQWKQALAAKVAQLRDLPPEDLRFPDQAPIELYIATGRMAGQLPQRASA